MVLAEEKNLGLFNDVAGILDQSFALGGKLVRGLGQGTGCEEAVESNVNLFVLRIEKLVLVWNEGAEMLMVDLRMGPCHFGRLEDGQRR
jgi:hypothetical protein